MSAPRSLSTALLGRSFVHPVFDLMLIGGGLSLVVTLVIVARGSYDLIGAEMLPFVFLAANSAHFASSTVRLYTKPGAREGHAFLTMVFPLVALGLLTLCVFEAGTLGPHLQALYLTWSPYHYAAQAYGLAVMYSYRSGCALSDGDKRLLRRACLLPFFFAFVRGGQGSGLGWILPDGVLAQAWFGQARSVASLALGAAAFAAPLLLFAKVWRSASGPMPAIALVTMVSNAVWWIALPPLQAFFWATIFHGIQYLAIVVVFHVKDRMAMPGNRHGRAYHAFWFYGASLVLAYALFSCLPQAYALAGFGTVESTLLVVAAINVHHFVVDAYIWRLRKDAGNRRVVEALPVPA